MIQQLSFILYCVVFSHALPKIQPSLFDENNKRSFEAADINPIPPVRVAGNTDPIFLFREMEGGFVNMDIDGVQAESTNNQQLKKKHEKLPVLRDVPFFKEGNQDKPDQPKIDFDQPKDYDFLKPQPGVAPKFTGSFSSTEKTSSEDFEYFNFGEGEGPIINPAATYLEGGNFDKIPAPKCRMIGCTGPLPNDGSFNVNITAQNNESCHQTFVPMNGCTDNKGYPMGMLCSICCECSAEFIKEMKNTSGYIMGYST
uniref:Uncharacterized protein n=1 Tax=Heterorhabditis bacteriophora TaxID=37862 RepID=A0A1I7WQB6_HETBA